MIPDPNSVRAPTEACSVSFNQKCDGYNNRPDQQCAWNEKQVTLSDKRWMKKYTLQHNLYHTFWLE